MEGKLDKIIEGMEKIRMENKSNINNIGEKISQLERSINERNGEIWTEVNKLKSQVETQEKKIQYFDSVTRRKNLVIFGIKEDKEKESHEELKIKLLDLLHQRMGLKIETFEMDYFYRMGNQKANKGRPILLKLLN